MTRSGWPQKILGLVLVCFIAATMACSDDEGAPPPAASEMPPKKLTFMAGFKPQANLPFVGVYIAQEKGFFRDLNLEVDIQHAQAGEHLQNLLANTVQVTTANGASVLKRQEQGLDVVSIALIGQDSEQGFAVGAGSGINSVSDWAGKTFGYRGSVPTEFLAITRAAGIDPNRVRQVRVGFDARILSEGQVDILAVFFSNEPGQLDQIGFKTKVFDPGDFGIPSLGLTYIATREQIQKDPDLLERFLRASLRGIEYALANREEAVDIVMKFAPMESRDHQKFMLGVELDRAQTDLTKRSGIGWQTKDQWQAFHDSLLQYSGIEKAVDVNRAFTDEFLRKIYKDGRIAWPD